MPKIKRTRRVAVLYDDGHAGVQTQRVPAARRGQVLIRTAASLISPGTELSGATTARAAGVKSRGKGRPFGYQSAGTVVKAAAGVTDLSAGDRVACMGAGYALHAELAVVPHRLCVPLPDNVPFEQGAYGHLAATALHALRRGRIQFGEHVLIVGLGVLGQIAAQLARLAGAYVMGWDLAPGRLRLAKRCGIHATASPARDDLGDAARQFTGGRGFDAAILAFGGEGTDVLRQVHDVMTLTPDGHREGRVVIVGGVEARTGWAAGMGNLDVLSSARPGPGYHDDAWEHGTDDYPYPWVRWTTQHHLELTMRLLSERRLDVKSLTTHLLPLSRVDEAVTALIETPDKAVGALLKMH